jgi:hypothetical protein
VTLTAGEHFMTTLDVKAGGPSANDGIPGGDGPSPHTRIIPTRAGQFAARLGFELLVVFAGVTLAFFAEN